MTIVQRMTLTKGIMMHCPNCGAHIASNANFCPTCGSPLPGVQDSAPPQKRRHVIRWVLLSLLVVIVLTFALAAVGVIPRFWSFVTPSGDNEQTTHDKWAAQGEGDGIKVPEGDLKGVDPDSIRRNLEAAGFTDVKVEWFYEFDVYGDSERNNRAASTTIKDGPDLEPGEALKDSTPIVIKALKAPEQSEIRQRIADATSIQNRLRKDSTWFEGTWHGTRVASGGSELNTSKCDADTKDDMLPTVTIASANDTALTLQAEVRALMHYHANDKPRTYDSSDDKLEDLGSVTGSGSIVMGPGEYGGREVIYQELPAIKHQEKDDKGQSKEVEHAVKLYLAIDTDLKDNMSDDELVSMLKEVLGDDVSKEFEDEEKALDVLQSDLENGDHTWLTLVVDQVHDGIFGSEFLEAYQLEKESSGNR